MTATGTDNWVETMRSWPHKQTDQDTPVSTDESGSGVELTKSVAAEPAPTEEPKPVLVHPPRFDVKVAGFIAAVVVGALLILIVGASAAFSGSSKAPEPVPAAATLVPPPAPSASAPAAAQGVDHPIPYEAEAKCPEGSRPAQNLSDPSKAFVCVRKGLDGWVIHIYLGSKAQPRSYRVTAIALTPGAVDRDAGGADQWSQHRVASLLQYNFNDDTRSVVQQDTGNVHGEVVQPIANVLASEITIIVRQTSRPPKAPPSSAPGAPQGGTAIDSILNTDKDTPWTPPPLGAGTDSSVPDDPVDATFAMSGLKILGHEPL